MALANDAESLEMSQRRQVRHLRAGEEERLQAGEPRQPIHLPGFIVLSRRTAEVVGGIRHRRQTSSLEQIVIWRDGDKNLHVKVKKNGVGSPDGTELDMTFNDSGHVTDAWWD